MDTTAWSRLRRAAAAAAETEAAAADSKTTALQFREALFDLK